MKKDFMKNKKANIVFLKNVEYIENSKVYKSDECILKEEFCNTEYYHNTIKEVSLKTPIDMNFDTNEYFKINTDIFPWSDPMYLRYFNNRNIDVDEIETDDDIIITYDVDSPKDLLICFQTKAEYGVYKAVMKYNLFKLVKEIDCDLWAPLDIRKPFKLVEKNRVVPINSKNKSMNVIGEIKQEQTWWAIYHPVQIRETLFGLKKQKEEIEKIKKPFLKKKAFNKYKQNCLNLKELLFVENDDEYYFTSQFAQFW